MHSVLLSAEYFPATQSMHVYVAAFTEIEYFPGPQSVHASDPLMALYLPDTQPTQSPFVPVQPALQTHEVLLKLPAAEYAFTHNTHIDLFSAEYSPVTQFLHVYVAAFAEIEYFPGPQSVHASDPLLALYLPGTQPIQSPFVPVHPALQVHEVLLKLLAAEYAFTHHTHIDLSSAEYFPAIQSLHVFVTAVA